MREGEPSPTAQRVAAYRLGYERLPAPFGDPDADERLARDVAGSLRFEQYEAMGRYLRWRTSFFDRVVVNALARDVAQVATIGAGYDGRSLRYAKPGVRWFEVDHPATQRDKRLRLERLSIDASDVTFVGTDLADGALASALIDAGWEPDAPSAMLCEGVVVYLEASVLEALLNDLRAVATVGTRLALSLSIQASGPEELAGRRRFEEAVAALGEPARNWLDHDSASVILAGARWRTVEVSERSQRAGFVVAAPVWDAAAYARHVELSSAELERLAPAIAALPVIFESWAFCTGRKQLPEVVESLSANRARAEGIAVCVEQITGR